MQHKRPPLPAIIVVILLIAAGIYYGVRALNGNENKDLSASGTIESAVVNVSPQIAGRVKEVLFEEGQPVKQGDPLFVLDQNLLAAQREVAQRGVDSAHQALLTASSIVRERERGTIEQLIVTPIRSWELVVGKIMPYTILAFIDMVEILIIGHWWFKVPIRGDLGLIFLLSGLFLLSSLGIGLFASTIANTQQEAFITVMVTMLPSLFLSGFFFPIEAMPKFLQYVSALVPLRYYLVIIRALLLKGVGAVALQNQIIALSIFAVFILGAAALRFRKRLD
jgi:hypothetical protein